VPFRALNAIGLGPNAAAGIALVAGIDRALDMCRTTVNTFSNLVGAALIASGDRGEEIARGELEVPETLKHA
jgi:Na+/H+-dicarboxylate symporter